MFCFTILHLIPLRWAFSVNLELGWCSKVLARFVYLSHIGRGGQLGPFMWVLGSETQFIMFAKQELTH